MYMSVAVYVSLWHLMTVSGSKSLRIFFVFFFIFPFWLTTSIFLCSSFIILLLLYTHTYIHAYSKKWGRKPLLHIHTYIHAYSKKWSRKPLWLFYISCLISLPEGRLIIAIKGKSKYVCCRRDIYWLPSGWGWHWTTCNFYWFLRSEINDISIRIHFLLLLVSDCQIYYHLNVIL